MNPDFPKNERDEQEAKLTALLLGELNAEEAAAVREQINNDPELGRLYQRLQQTIQLVRESALDPVAQESAKPAPLKLSSDRREKLLAAFKTIQPKEFQEPRRKAEAREWLVAAATVAAVLLLAAVTIPNFVKGRATAQKNGIINNLRQIDGAKQQWALEKNKPADAKPTVDDLAPYLGRGNGTDLAWLRNGKYTIGAINESPKAEIAANRGEVISLDSDSQLRTGATVTYKPAAAAWLNDKAVLSGRLRDDSVGTVMTGTVTISAGSVNTMAIDSAGAGRPTAELHSADRFNYYGRQGNSGGGGAGGGSILPGEIPAGVQGSGAVANNSRKDNESRTLWEFSEERAGAVTNALTLNGALAKSDASAPTDRAADSSVLRFDDKTHGGMAGREQLLHNNLDLTNTGRMRFASGDDVVMDSASNLIELGSSKTAGNAPLSVSGNLTMAGTNVFRISVADHLNAGDTYTVLAYDGTATGVNTNSVVIMPPPFGYAFQLVDPATTPGSIQAKVTAAVGFDFWTGNNATNPTVWDDWDKNGARVFSSNDFAAFTDQNTVSTVAGSANAALPQSMPLAVNAPSTISAPASELPAKKGAQTKSENRSKQMAQLAEDAKPREASVAEPDLMPAKPASPPPTPQPEVTAANNPFSTFSLNVSDVSFRLAAASLQKGVMPEPGSIRSEEFINAFDYRDPAPAPAAPVAFASERAHYPFAHNRDLLRFAIKTAAAGREAGRPLNIVLLLDNSGSMERADRVRIIREALHVLAAQLQPQDRLSIVTFARTAQLRIDGVSGSQAGGAVDAVIGLTPQGGTNLEEAMRLAYETAHKHYLANGVNRVVLLTDGAANLGDVEPTSLEAKVERERQQGIALDCFGIGWDGYNDDLLEMLSRHGDGRYGFLNTPADATSGFAAQLAGALKVAASDVKVQVEFNAKRVTAWRQIGYAKHQLAKEQFRDNKVDAAEIGAAEAGNALYVIETRADGEGPIATVRVRYKVPGTTDYREQSWAVAYNGDALSLEQSSPAMRLAGTASAFSELLASSPFAGEVTPDRLARLIAGVPEAYGRDPRPATLARMILQARSVSGK
jgi:Mg-chelatase subunit ChlD